MARILVLLLVTVLMVGCSANPTVVPMTHETTDDTKPSTTDQTPVEGTEFTGRTTEMSSPMPTITPRLDADVRNVKWGDNVETVKQYEADEIAESLTEMPGTGSSMTYSGYLGSYKIDIIYVFDTSGILYNIVYDFKNDESSDALYISHYEIIKALLVEKYGDAEEDVIIKNGRYSEYRGAVEGLRNGEHIYRTQWSTDRTNIMLAMALDEGRIRTVISYISKIQNPTIDGSYF